MDLSDFGFLANMFDGSEDGDKGASFPRSDAEDMGNGARFIPGAVTVARRKGEKVQFLRPCGSPCCWFWQMPDGSRIYHYESFASQMIEKDHKGICPNCSNDFIKGGVMNAKDAEKHKQKVPVANTATKAGARSVLVQAKRTGITGLIEAQEAEGQESLVKSDTLPRKIDNKSLQILTEAGVVFGEFIPDDELFRYVTLPEGWKKVATDHSMWSNLVDETGKVRAEIFYKAAFYDRDAFIRAVE